MSKYGSKLLIGVFCIYIYIYIYIYMVNFSEFLLNSEICRW